MTETALEKIDELEQLFDLQWQADQRAIKRWQDAHPGNDLVWPDRADMVVWLMEQHEAPPPREVRARALYLAVYESQGANWDANECKELWCEKADRYLELLRQP